MILFDRTKLKILPLSRRKSKSNIENIILDPAAKPKKIINQTSLANKIIQAKENNKPIILAFGAHLIKNGLSLTINKLIEKGYITHLATNGASSIHDWEIAYQGKTEEDVREYVELGQFGIWDETGKYINLAITEGAKQNKGYGESICELIHNNQIGDLQVQHPFKKFSIQDSAFSKNIPFTVHPGFGYDIIYTHPLSDGASIGKTAETDFLKFVNSVSKLEGGGVYLSIGSAIMSPMIFEKSLSMARNIAHQNQREIKDFTIIVNDIQDEKTWDFDTGKEPTKNDPAYYSRLCKSFSRMGAKEMHYIKADNRDFLLSLYQSLRERETI